MKTKTKGMALFPKRLRLVAGMLFTMILTTSSVAFAAWEDVGSDGFAGSATYTSLAFSGTTPYVAFIDGGAWHSVSVMKFSDGVWQYVGKRGLSDGQAHYVTLAFYLSVPYVAFSDSTNSAKATVMRFTGNKWEPVGMKGFSDGHAAWISLAFSGPTPYVAFSDSTNSKATVMKFNGTDWEAVGKKGFSDGEAMYTSLAFLGSTPYVAYQDYGNTRKATVMKFNGTDWEAVGKKGFSELQATYTSLAFSGTTPYVAFAETQGSIPVAVAVMSYPPTTTRPDPPVLTITTTGITVEASWTTGLHHEGYILSYAPYPYAGPDTIVSVDMGAKTGLTIDLWEGAAFLVAVQAYNYNSFGTSDYSNIVQFILGQ